MYYRTKLLGEVLRLSAAVQPEVSRDTMESVAKGMSVAQLDEFRTAYEKKLSRELLPKPQLCEDQNRQPADNGDYLI